MQPRMHQKGKENKKIGVKFQFLINFENQIQPQKKFQIPDLKRYNRI